MFALDARQVTKHEGLTTDYETAALPAELRRRGVGKTLHSPVSDTSSLL
jgi:hypothetical protein